MQDFLMTLLMRSRINGANVAFLDNWLRLPEKLELLRDLAVSLGRADGLAELPDDAVEQAGRLVDKLLDNEFNGTGIGVAKVFKWLSVWAPGHVPMIDRLVHYALTGKNAKKQRAPSALLLRQFRRLLIENRAGLTELAQALSDQVRFPVTPVRVLDSLIWFDWDCEEYASRRREFKEFIDFRQKDKYPARQRGL